MYCYIPNNHKFSSLKQHSWAPWFYRSSAQAAQWVLCFLPHGTTVQVSVGRGPSLDTGGGSASQLIQVVGTIVVVAPSTLFSCWVLARGHCQHPEAVLMSLTVAPPSQLWGTCFTSNLSLASISLTSSSATA